MKTPIEQVDEFIQRLVEGDIESRLQEYKKGPGITSYTQIDNLMAHFQETLEAYMAEQVETHKKQLAIGLLNMILDLRLKPILMNNPNTVRFVAEHRDFYKSRAVAAEERNKDIEDKLRAAYESNEKLQAMLEDSRKGREGMHQR
jgi:hypothetical protein